VGNTNKLEDPDLLDFVDGIVGHEPDAVSSPDGSLEYTKINDGSPERVIVRVKDEGL
jgi:hypothetical protein